MQYHWHCGFGVKWLITSRFGDFIYVRETFDTSMFRRMYSEYALDGGRHNVDSDGRHDWDCKYESWSRLRNLKELA